jgi:hypothetical protein
MAIIAAPTTCPLIPRGSGIFNVIITNMPAAKTAIKGTDLSSRLFLAHLWEKNNAIKNITKYTAHCHNGIMLGICIILNLLDFYKNRFYFL